MPPNLQSLLTNLKAGFKKFRDRFPILTTYGIAALITLSVVFLKVRFQYLYSGPPFLLFFTAVTVSAWIGGLGSGIFSSLLGGILASKYFGSPQGTWDFDILIFLTFAAEGSLASYIVDTHRRSTKSLGEAEQKIAKQYLFDELTNLPNKKYFSEKSFRFLEEKREAVLFSIDLDHFREVNELMGREKGDAFLKTIAERIESSAGEDAIVGRLDGDNFLVMTPHYNQDQSEQTAERLQKEISKPINLGDRPFSVTASIGIAMYPEFADNISGLIKNAEIAMRHVKDKRGSHMFYDPSQGMEFARKIYLAQEIKEGIAKNEFEMYYQPIFDIKNKTLIRGEALIRWNHPTQGLLYPGEFIPISEETGSILPLNEWVFEKVCNDMKDWENQGLTPIKISINLSGRQFSEKNLVKKIEKTLRKTGVDPNLLEVEISESVALRHTDRNAIILNQIKDLGIQVALDDFGTGYASLSYLTKFPIDTVKIDQSFIASAQKNLASKAVIKSIVILAYQLNLNYIVEGIENHDQLEFMSNLNCTWMQGFFLGKPLPQSEFISLMKDTGLRYTLKDLIENKPAYNIN